MAKKRASFKSSQILLIGLIITALWAGAATLRVFKMNKVVRFANNFKDVKSPEKIDLYSYSSVYGEWSQFDVPETTISFKHPPMLRVVEFPVESTNLETKNKNIVPESAYRLTFPEQVDQQLAEVSGVLSIFKVKEPIGVLTTLNSGNEVPYYVDISQHTEQFGKKNVWVVKAKYDDGPCAGSYLYRYVLPYDEGNIVVEDTCTSTDIFSHSEMEKFLSSFSE